MKTAAALMIGLCLAFGTYCRAEDDLAKARKELQATLDAVVIEHPEADDHEAFIRKRIKGKNGWSELAKVAEEWAKTRLDDDGTNARLEHVSDPSPDAYSDTERSVLRVNLEASRRIAEAAAKLLDFDCLTPTLPNFLDEVDGELPSLTVAQLLRCLSGRGIALAALQEPNADVADAVLLSFRLTMLLDTGINVLGAGFTTAIQMDAMKRGMAAAGTLQDQGKLLSAMARVKAVSHFGRRDSQTGELASFVRNGRRLLGMTDKELLKEAEEIAKVVWGEKASPLAMLQATRDHLIACKSLLPHFPSHGSTALPVNAKRLASALETMKEPGGAEQPLSIGSLQAAYLVRTDLFADALRLELDLRIHEAQHASWPAEQALKTILARHPGFVVRHEGKALVLDAAADHPVRKLPRESLLHLPHTLEPRTSH